VNVTEKEAAYSAVLPQEYRKTGRLVVVSEDRTTPVRNGGFEDKLGAYGVRILTSDSSYPALTSVTEVHKRIAAERKRLLKTGNLCYLGRGTTVETNGFKRHSYKPITGYYDRRYCWGYHSYEGAWLKVAFAAPQTVDRIVLYSPNLGGIRTRMYGGEQITSLLEKYDLELLVGETWAKVRGKVTDHLVERKLRPGHFVFPLKFNFRKRTHALRRPVASVKAIRLRKLERSGMLSGLEAYGPAGAATARTNGVPARRAAAGNLLGDYNPGFEDQRNGLVSWDTRGMAVALIENRPAESIHSGKRSLRIESKKDQAYSGYIVNTAQPEVRAGDRVAVTYWVKGRGKFAVGLFRYVDKGGTRTREAIRTESIPHQVNVAGEWQERRFTYEVERNVYALQLMLYVPPARMYPRLYGDNWHVMIDDVSMSIKGR